MQYGTQTRLKSIYPYVRRTQDNPSPKALFRLKWMEYISLGHSMSQCSRHFDYPERTIRFWRTRYDIFNLKSLEDRSKRPKHTRATVYDAELLRQVSIIRKKRPFGKKKIKVILQRSGLIYSQSKIQKAINILGLKRTRKYRKKGRTNRKHMYTVEHESLGKIGGLIYFDVKHLRLNGSQKVYQFTCIDHSTRMLFAKVYTSITSRCGKEFFLYVQGKLEHKILNVGSDNGSEFLGDFEKLLSDLKITHVFSSPRSPKQNPYVERVIRNVIDECYSFEGVGYDIASHTKILENYVYDYNNIRPHESLNLETPNQRYVKLTTKSYTI